MVRSIQCLAAMTFLFHISQNRTFAQDPNAEALQHYQAGQRAQAAGSYAIAVQDYQKVIALMPQAAEAYASLGLAYNAENKFEESAHALEKAERLKPGLPGVSLYLGIDLVKQTQATAAIRSLQEATRLEPDNPQAWLWLGSAFSEAGRTADAIDALRRAEHLQPTDPDVLFRLGEAYKNAADSGVGRILADASGQPLVHQVYGDIYKDEQLWVKATGHYRRALAEDPRWPQAHLRLGEIDLHQGRLGDAEKELEQELAIQPGSASAEAELAALALLQGDLPAALAGFDRAIHTDPVEAAFALGLSRPATEAPDLLLNSQELNQLQACLPALTSAPQGRSRTLALAFVNLQLGKGDIQQFSWGDLERTLPPTTHGNAYAQALAAFHKGKMDLAIGQLHAWLQARPNDLKATYLLSRCYRNLSMDALGRLLQVAPDSYAAHSLLGETYENAENYEKALEEYRAAENKAPELPGIHFAMGRLLEKTGAPDQALAEFQQELQVDPHHAEAKAEIGALLVQRGEQDRGMTYLKEALALEPGLWPAHRELGHAYALQKRYAQAETELKQAIAHDPDGSAHYQLGLVYRALGQIDAAKQMFAKAQQTQADQLFEANAPRALPEAERP